MENAEEKDFYKDWLGIPEGQRPPNHYQLLGIPEFESDPDTIRKAALKQYAKAKVYESSVYHKDCIRIVAEIRTARNVLSNPAKKQAYDRNLRQTTPQIGVGAEAQYARTDALRAFREEAQAITRSEGQLNEAARDRIYLTAQRRGIQWGDVAAVIDELETDWPKQEAAKTTTPPLHVNDSIQREESPAQPPQTPGSQGRAPAGKKRAAVSRLDPAKLSHALIHHIQLVVATCVATAAVAFLVRSIVLFVPLYMDPRTPRPLETAAQIGHPSETPSAFPAGTLETRARQLPALIDDVWRRAPNNHQKPGGLPGSVPPADGAQASQERTNREASPQAEKQRDAISHEEQRRRALRSYSVAQALFDSEDYEACLRRLQQFIEEYPKSELVSDARKMLRKAKTRLSDLKEAEKLYATGKTALDAKRYRSAVEPFEQLIQKYPESEWAPSAKRELERISKLLMERIASNAWVMRYEHEQLKRAGWVGDATRKLKEIADSLEGWSFTAREPRLSKKDGDIDLTLTKRREGKVEMYLSGRATQQIVEKALLFVGDEWATVDQLQERGLIRFGKDWLTPPEYLEHMVLKADVRFTRIFGVRDQSMFGDAIRRRSTTRERVLRISKPKLLHFQPGVNLTEQGAELGIEIDRTPREEASFAGRKRPRRSAEIAGGFRAAPPGQNELADEDIRKSKWIAASATVTVGYQVEITDYFLTSALFGKRPTRRVASKMKRTEKATYLCLLIREGAAIRKFLDDKKKSGEFDFSSSQKIYKIRKPSTPGFSAMQMSASQKAKQYCQSIYFADRQYGIQNGIVIAVIHEPELSYIFQDLREHMEGQAARETLKPGPG